MVTYKNLILSPGIRQTNFDPWINITFERGNPIEQNYISKF